MVANPDLIKIMNVPEENVLLINALHESREEIATGVAEGRILKESGLQLLDDIEYSLQYLWGFNRDKNYHRFWDLPGCTCPKLDNNDSYPTGHYVVNMLCPIHGEEDKNIIMKERRK